MSDDFNFFDDDSLTPAWLKGKQDADPGPADVDPWQAPAEEAPAWRAEPLAGSGPGLAPWQQLAGAAPPAYPRLMADAPPWETLAGSALVSLAAPATRAPWEHMPGSAAAATVSDVSEFSWAADHPDAPAPGQGEIPAGLTSALPWMAPAGDQPAPDSGLADDVLTDFEEPPSPTGRAVESAVSLAELAGLTDEKFTMDSLISDLGTPAEETAPPEEPSLRDRLLALSPKPEPSTPDASASAPPALRADESAWMGAFGQSADFTAPDDSGPDDMAWLEATDEAPAPAEPVRAAPPPEPPPPVVDEAPLAPPPEAAALPADEASVDEVPAIRPIRRLPGTESLLTPTPEPAAEPGIEPLAADDWLDEDFAEFAALDDAADAAPIEIPDWLDSTSDDFGDDDDEFQELDEEAFPADELPDWLAAPAEPPDEPPDEPPSAPPAEAPLPERPERPSSGIRRIVPLVPTPAQDEVAEGEVAEGEAAEGEAAEDDTMPDWVGSAQEQWESGAAPEGMTYDEWERIHQEQEEEAARSAEDRMMDEVPDWFQKEEAPLPPEFADLEADSGQGPEFMPGWFLGLEEQSDEEKPAWMQDLDFSGDALARPLETPSEPEAADAPPAPVDVPAWAAGDAEIPDLGVDWDAMFGAPAEAAAEPAAPRGLSRLSNPDDSGDSDDDDIAPGEVPDWLAAAAPAPGTPDDVRPDLDALFDAVEADAGISLPEGDLEAVFTAADLEAEAPAEMMAGLEPEMPEPDLDALFGAADEAAGADFDLEPAEVPEWLAEPAPETLPETQMVVAPEDVPFPDLDLDQTMPTEVSADTFQAWMMAEEEAEAAEEPAGAEEFAGAEELEAAPVEDFIERFEPLEPDEYAAEAAPLPPTLAPVDDDAPAWLRDLAEQGIDSVLAPEEALPLPGDIFGEQMPEAVDEMDWLAEISPEDLVEEPPVAAGSFLDEIDFRDEVPLPDAGVPPEDELITAEAFDSEDIDALLALSETGLLEAEPEPEADIELWEPEEVAVEAAPEAAAVAADEREAVEPSLEEQERAFDEIFGVPDPDLLAAEAAEILPGLDDLDSAERVPGEAVEMDADRLAADAAAREAAAPLLPPTPETTARFGRQRTRRRGRFGRRREAEEPEAPPIEVDLQPTDLREQVDWVADLRPSDLPVTLKLAGTEVSIRQTPVSALPPRLRDLRDRVRTEVPEPEPLPSPDEGVLAGVAGALPLLDSVLPHEASGALTTGLTITREQQRRVERLQAMLENVAAEEEVGRAEVRADVDIPDAFRYEADEEIAAGEEVARRARRRVQFKLDRILVALVVLAALVVPFATDALHFAADPPALENERLAVADQVVLLSPGQYVLVAFEYGPTAAGEMDGLTEAVLRDVLVQGAIPLATSTNPVGAFHAAAVFEPLVTDAALLAARGQNEDELVKGEDFVLLSYLPGDAIGVRSLADTNADEAGNLKLHPAFETDLRGDHIELGIRSLETDIALIIVSGESSGDLRMWAEQLSDVSVPMVALVSAAVEPLALPYMHEDAYAGYLAGVRDMYSYNAARNTVSRTPYSLPEDAPDIPNPEESRWHSMALGAAAAAGLVALGMLMNLLRTMTRRRRR